ncbi:hypothetical protein TSUD_256160 [Trifolium subterraneum]|uniref:Uncharacterized protein n=1 Tax=Trifolium subterraneum TaxID=3900 RepID=A0A2Z6M9P7_TRISU|nr:hypothetical protein TSUD_256160 [Trifolium subterraneum]
MSLTVWHSTLIWGVVQPYVHSNDSCMEIILHRLEKLNVVQCNNFAMNILSILKALNSKL